MLVIANAHLPMAHSAPDANHYPSAMSPGTLMLGQECNALPSTAWTSLTTSPKSS